MALSMLFSASSAVFADENVPLLSDNSEVELYAYTGTEVLEGRYATYTLDYDNKTMTVDRNDKYVGIMSSDTNAGGSIIKSHYQGGKIRNVIINEGITSIGDYGLFAYDIYSLKLPSTLKSIGSHALGYLKFDSIVIPKSVTKLDQDAFDSFYEVPSVDDIYFESYKGIHQAGMFLT